MKFDLESITIKLNERYPDCIPDIKIECQDQQTKLEKINAFAAEKLGNCMLFEICDYFASMSLSD